MPWGVGGDAAGARQGGVTDVLVGQGGYGAAAGGSGRGQHLPGFMLISVHDELDHVTWHSSWQIVHIISKGVKDGGEGGGRAGQLAGAVSGCC